MCTSETVVCFGIVIRSWQLIVAAHAFVKISPLLRGIDIIIARRRNGTLRVGAKVEGMRTIENMPLEVLEIIRGKVFDETELEKSASRLALDNDTSAQNWKKIPVPHEGEDSGCECWDDRINALININFEQASFLTSVSTLLEYYELKLASLGIGNQENWEIEDGSTSVVTLAASMKNITVEVDHDGLSRANGMKLPRQTNRFDSALNFHRFYRDFHFDIVTEISTPPSPISSASSSPSLPAVKTDASEESKGTGSKASAAMALVVVKPEWIVWTSTVAC